MKTTLLPDALRRLLGLVLVAWLFALTGCGPGSGGTGTGPQTFSVGPAAAPLGNGGSGASALRADCGRECPPAVLHLDPTFVELQSQCLRFVHSGAVVVGGTHASVQGTLQTTTAGETSTGAATLQLQFTTEAAASPIVVVTVIDASGRTVLGPQVLNRTDDGAALPATPCSN